MNYFEEGSLLSPISLLFSPQLWEGISYLLCTHSAVELYKSLLSGFSEFIVHLQIDCCVHICVEMQALGLKPGET